MNSVLAMDRSELNEDDFDFLNNVDSNLVQSHPDGYHLPYPVFSYTKPTMGVQFLLHILLSLGHFDTDINLTTHASIRKCFRYAKLIGVSDDTETLKEDICKLLLRYAKQQVIYFLN